MAMNELERLKEALDAERVEPRAGAREAAVGAALAAFDAKIESRRQGSRLFSRLRSAAHAAFETVTGRRHMRMTTALAGGVSLAVLTLAVLTAANLETFNGLRQKPASNAAPPVEQAADASTAAMKSDATSAATSPRDELAAQATSGVMRRHAGRIEPARSVVAGRRRGCSDASGRRFRL